MVAPVETSHPPPYGTDHSPAYELQERPSVPRAQSSTQTFDDAAIESCAPKPPPRKFVWTLKIKIWLGMALLALAGLLAAMIWLGVTRKREKDQTWPANLSLATSSVEPWVPSSPIPADGTFISPFNFSSPTSSYIPSSNRQTDSNYTILSSSSQRFNLSANQVLFIKVFGSHSTQVTIFQADNLSTSDHVVDVQAFWRVPDPSNETASMALGVEELSRTSGGSYYDGDGQAGVVLQTSSDAVYQPTLWSSGLSSEGNNTLVFNITVTLAPSFYISNLSIFAEPDTTVIFWNLSTVSIGAIDVRAPRGFIDSEINTTAQDIHIFAGHWILGTWNTYQSLSFLCRKAIQTTLNFLSSPSRTTSTPPFSATLITKDLAGAGDMEGTIFANVTSLPSDSSLNFNAVALNSTVQVSFPKQTFQGSWSVATNTETARAIVTEEGADGSFQSWNEEGRTSWKGETTVGGVKGGGSGSGKIELDAGNGLVHLAFGDLVPYSY